MLVVIFVVKKAVMVPTRVFSLERSTEGAFAVRFDRGYAICDT